MLVTVPLVPGVGFGRTMLLRGMLRGVLILPQPRPNILESQSLVCPRGRRLLTPRVWLRMSLVWVLLCQLPLLPLLGLWTLLLLLMWPRAKAFCAICAITSSMSCQNSNSLLSPNSDSLNVNNEVSSNVRDDNNEITSNSKVYNNESEESIERNISITVFNKNWYDVMSLSSINIDTTFLKAV